MKKIFISYPYASNPELNFKKVDKICKYWLRKGYMPISPLHTFSYHEDDSYRKQILKICEQLIDISDVVAIYGESRGCRHEEKYAMEKGKTILRFYEEVDWKELVEENREVYIQRGK